MALTTLANVKAWLEMDMAVTAQDAVITRLIDSCSVYIESWLSRKIAQAVYTEAYDGKGSNAITLAEYPITALTSVSIDGVAQVIVPNTEFNTVGARYHERQLVINGKVFSRGRGNVLVTYQAGYATVPADIEQACIELVSLRLKNARKANLGIQSKTLAGESITFFSGAMPDSTRDMLLEYRNVVPA
jgi:hypothetical protein